MQWQRPSTGEIMAIKLEVNNTGCDALDSPASPDLLCWGSVAPRNKAERDIVEAFLARRKERCVVPTL